MSRSVLGREFCPKTGSNFQDCFLTSSGLVTCQVFAVWSNVLWPQPNNSELENLLKLERAVMAAKAFKFCHFHGSWWLGRRNESTWTLLRKPCNINSSIVCSVFPVSFQPAQEDRGAQAEAATVCLCCFWGAMWAGAIVNASVNGASQIWYCLSAPKLLSCYLNSPNHIQLQKFHCQSVNSKLIGTCQV